MQQTLCPAVNAGFHPTEPWDTLIFFFISHSENRTKNITEVSADKKLLNYTQQKTFLFDANNSMSGAQETDVICTVNLPLVVRVCIHIHTIYVCIRVCMLSQYIVCLYVLYCLYVQVCTYSTSESSLAGTVVSRPIISAFEFCPHEP